ncbi:MAG: PAS domain S-box protein [Halobacteriota archaeon]
MASGTLTDRLRETLALFARKGDPLTTTEVANSLDVGRRSTYERLEKLVEHDRLKTKKVGANARVWWRPSTKPSGQTPDWSAAADSLVDDVLNDVAVGIFVLDENFEVAWINEATERYFGLDRDAVLGQNKRALVDERIAPRIEESNAFGETVLATYDDNTYTERFECHVTADDGREARWLEHRSKPIEAGAYAGGRVELYYDITDQKHSEQARQRDRKQFESMVEAVEEHAIFMLDPDGYIQTWNPGAEQIKGYSTEEILGEHFSTFYTDGARENGAPAQNLEAAAVDGSVRDEGWRVRKDGSKFWASVTITSIRDDEGDLQGYVKVTRDMTDRREREQQLREETAFTESILDNQRDLVYAVDNSGTFLRWNDRFQEVTGYANAEIETMHPVDFIADEATDEATATIERVFEQGDNVTVEFPLETANGETIPYEFVGGPLTDENGDIVGLTGVGRDISDRKAVERRLERQRDELAAELDDVFDRIDDAVHGLDENWRITYLNDRAEELLGKTEAELVGKNVWDVFPEALERSYREEYERAMETQEPVTFEEYSDVIEAWVEVRAFPSETGLSIYFRDVTERKRRERELEQYERIIETVDDGIYVLDSGHRFRLVNNGFASMTGYDRDELIDSRAEIVFRDEFVDIVTEKQSQLESGQLDIAVMEEELNRADGTSFIAESRFDLFELEDGETGRVGVVRDISDRVERERVLEESRRRYRTLVEHFPNGAVTLVDGDLRYRTVGGTPPDAANTTIDELEGSSVREGLPSELADLLVPRYEAALDGDASTFEEEVGERSYEFRVVPVRDDDGDVFTAMGMSQDITERKRYEERLRALYTSSRELLQADTASVVSDVLVDTAGDVLDIPGLVVYRYDDEQNRLVPEIQSTEAEFMREEFPVISPDDNSLTGRVFGRGDTQYYENVLDSPHLQVSPDATEMRAGLFVPLDNERILVAGSRDVDGFDASTRQLVELLSTNATAAYQRVAREQELVRQRAQFVALNGLNEVVSEITTAVIDQSTREEIEATVCEYFAASESYEFAWICEVDSATGSVVPRIEAGVEGYVEEIPLSIDPDDPAGRGPTGEAIRTHETQVANAFADADFEPWREYATRYGYQSSAAIPIVHDGTLYGVLGVYADRPKAFDGQEADVINQLGQIVGHAIAAAERKQALMSDELTELEFRIQDVFAALDAPVETQGTITLDHAVPVGDGEFLVYGTSTPEDMETVTGLVEAIPHWESVTVRSEGDPTSFELRLSDSPVLSVVASHGGYVDSAVIVDSDYQMTVHLAPSVDVRQVIDAVDAAYPQAEMLRRQQISREPDDAQRLQRRLVADLTDRQRTALEAAYHAGFFEWPRDTSGEEVADSMGVAPPTFHQHLRKAERKVFDSVFSTTAKVSG